jgi:peroxiredoxin
VLACHSAPAPSTPTAAAAPAPAASPVVAAPSAPAVAQPAWLGVFFKPDSTHVLRVVEGGPAATATVQAGDEIVSIDGVAMQSPAEIIKNVSARAPGSKVAVALTRDGSPMTFNVTLGPRPPDDKITRSVLVDHPAPAFTVKPITSDKPVSLADLRGRVVLLEFWATWCEPCDRQIPHLNAWHKKYAAKGLAILALSDEEADKVQQYAQQNHLNYPIATDPDDRVRSQFLVSGLPTTILIDKTGVVRYVAIGTVKPSEIEAAFTRLMQ